MSLCSLLPSHLGEQHKKQRKLLNPAFSTAHLRQTFPIMYSVVHRVTQALIPFPNEPHSQRDQMRDAVLRRTNKETYTEIDMLGWMSRTALELVGQAGLGISLDSLEDEGSGPYGEALKSFMCVFLRVASVATF